MNPPKKIEHAQLYKLKPSRLHIIFHLVFFGLVMISIPFLLSDRWMYLLLILTLLLAYQYLEPAYRDVLAGTNQLIEIRDRPRRMIWYDQDIEITVPWDNIKVYDNRWFILVKYAEFNPLFVRLFLADHFEDRSDYCRFRRSLRQQDS